MYENLQRHFDIAYLQQVWKIFSLEVLYMNSVYK